LCDIRLAFEAKGTDRLSSADLAEHLVSLDDRPWAEWKGKPLSKAALARLLAAFPILSGTIRLADDRTAKGYYLSTFDDAFERYLPSQNVTTSQAYSHGHCDVLENVTTAKPVSLSKTSQAYSHGHCDVVTFSDPVEEKEEAWTV
jgi:hypothetical protein